MNFSIAHTHTDPKLEQKSTGNWAFINISGAALHEVEDLHCANELANLNDLARGFH